MNYDPLYLAGIFGTLAVIMHIRHKAPRTSAIFGALTVLFILAGVPSLLAMLGHPIGRGPVLLGIVIATVVFAAFFYWDVLRGEHKTSLLSRKAIGGGGGQPGGGGGKAHNQHIRPLVASVGLTVFGLLVAMNFQTIASGTSGGFGQTATIITHSGS